MPRWHCLGTSRGTAPGVRQPLADEVHVGVQLRHPARATRVSVSLDARRASWQRPLRLMRLYHDGAEGPELERWRGLFDLMESTPASAPADDELYLRFADRRLSLHRGADTRGVRLEPGDLRRRLSGEFALAKACGSTSQRVLDVTAGLGIDALALRAKGFRIMLVERNAALWAMLDNYLHLHGPADVPLLRLDARELAGRAVLPEAPDVVYIDPMFADTRKTALPGKRMQYLRELLADMTDDSRVLLAMALDLARERVVLKRRRKDPVLVQPDWQVRARSVRYDVYDARAAQRSRRMA